MRAHLTTGDEIDCDVIIVSAGVTPNVNFLNGTRSTSSRRPGQRPAGDLGARHLRRRRRGRGADFFTGIPSAAIQPNAADQARVAALNMAGKASRSPGSLAINVLDTLGLISSSFGQWWGVPGGDGVELVDEANWYLSLQFHDDVLIGATAIGLTQHVGALRGLIQNRTRLGKWKAILMEQPGRFVEASVAAGKHLASGGGRSMK